MEILAAYIDGDGMLFEFLALNGLYYKAIQIKIASTLSVHLIFHS
jgi:hypothetical protein